MCLRGLFSKRIREDRRIIYPNDITSYNPITLSRSHDYCDNRIVTSHYTWWNFIPKNLYEQFHSIPNLLFATIALVYLFSIGADMAGAMFLIVSFNLCVTAVKDGVSDILRHKHDRVLNNKLFKYLNINVFTKVFCWEEKKACDIRVGNVIICEEGDEFPCDMLVLASSNRDRKVEVTTANLDGESSIKTYFSHSFTQNHFIQLAEIKQPVRGDSILSLEKLLIKVECENPVADLRRFEGKINRRIQTLPAGEQPMSETIRLENIVLRGARMRGAGYIIGMSVYTGKDTKLSLNCHMASRKYTSRESKLNLNLVAFMIVSIALSILFTIATGAWSVKNAKTTWYISWTKSTKWRIVQGILVYTFTTNTLVPISLIVTLELVQIFLATFISNDMHMHNSDQQLQSSTKTIHVADELGQIEFLFSDKTGTLTKNSMVLKLLTVFPTNQTYSVEEEESTVRQDQPMENGEDPARNQTVTQKGFTDAITKEMEYLLTNVALCNTVEVKRPIQSPEEGYILEPKIRGSYYATSPDEEALIIGAARIGFVISTKQATDGGTKQVRILLKQKTPNDQVGYKTLDYFVDAVIPFDFERKRMTVMARHPDGSCHIHSKGAESSILASEYRLRSPSHIQAQALEQVGRLSMKGLRTLVMASRKLSTSEYKRLLDEWNAAAQLFGNEREIMMNLLGKKIESELDVIGVTGIEDLLQDEVPQCLSNLRTAGIRIWVLTGDKEQTAVKVSQSAGHFFSGMTIFRITNCTTVGATAQRILGLFQCVENLMESLNPETVFDEHRPAVGDTRAAEIRLNERRQVQEYNLTDEDVADVVASITRLRAKLNKTTGKYKKNRWQFLRTSKAHRRLYEIPAGLVIDGQSLKYALDTALRPAFLDLCMYVNTVLCCRMTPIQKASVVEMVQSGLRECFGRAPVTAAVGDGGNDVAMIQQANVGIGIYGREGREAVRAADFAIPLFHHLRRLLLVHGHWAQYRVTRTMLLYYNKCAMFVTVRLLAISFAGFSGTAWFDVMYIVLFNLTMTSLASTAFGIVEKPFTAQQLLDNPSLYSKIARHRNLRVQHVVLHTVDGIWQGVVIFIIVCFVFCGGNSFAAGKFVQRPSETFLDYDSHMVTAAIFFLIVFCTNLRITIEMCDLNVFYLGSLLCTVILNGIIIAMIQVLAKSTSNQAHIFTNLFSNATFWLTVPVTMSVSMLPGLLWRVVSDYGRQNMLHKDYDSDEAVPKHEQEDVDRRSFTTNNFKQEIHG